MPSPLITATELQQLRAQGRDLVIIDCSFDLTNPAAGREIGPRIAAEGLGILWRPRSVVL